MPHRVTDRPASGVPIDPPHGKLSAASRRAASAANRRTAPAANRRTALRYATVGVAGLLALPTLAACAEEPITEPDVLVDLEVSAHADATAAAAAIARAPERQAALNTIATERTAHATALRAEIDRVIGVYGDGTTPAVATPAPVTSPAPAEPLSVEALRAQLTESRRAAADLAATLSGYRAGLLGSISAACAVHAEVLLA